MRAGSIPFRVEIQTYNFEQNTVGQQIRAWFTVTWRWANVQPLNGRELFLAQQLVAEVNSKITMRYYSPFADEGAAHKYRIKFRNKVYDIKSIIDPDEAQRDHVLMCRTGVVQTNG